MTQRRDQAFDIPPHLQGAKSERPEWLALSSGMRFRISAISSYKWSGSATKIWLLGDSVAISAEANIVGLLDAIFKPTTVEES